jgi:hypothetical protein
MQAPPPYPELLYQLGAFADRLEDIFATAVPDWRWRPKSDAWSLTEVMAHLRDVEREVYRPRYRAIISEDNPFLPGVSSDEWARTRDYQQQDGRAALDAFLAARRANVALLQSLDPELGQRSGQHAYLGQTTLQELLFQAAQHDEAHWEQIQALLDQES